MKTNILQFTLACVSIWAGVTCLADDPAPPLPYFSEKETGQYLPQLQQLKGLLKDSEKFTEVNLKLEEKLQEQSTKNIDDRKSFGKEEIAATEWIAYYNAKRTLPTVDELWERPEGRDYGCASVAALDIRLLSDKEIEEFQIDKKKILPIRAFYMAAIIKKLRTRRIEFQRDTPNFELRVWKENYKIAEAREKQKREQRLANSSKEPDPWKFGPTAEERADSVYIYNKITYFDSLRRYVLEDIPSVEREFLITMVRWFAKDSPQLIRQFAKQAGYVTDGQFAKMLLKVHTYAETDGILRWELEPYMKKAGFKVERLKQLAAEEDKREAREYEKVVKEYALIRAKMRPPWLSEEEWQEQKKQPKR